MNQCPACGVTNSAGARFCADCGTPIFHAPEASPDLACLLQAEIDPIREKLAEKYEVLRFIGRGGFSTVFLIRDKALDRLCALKILTRDQTINPESVERFKREARLYASLDHPHIVSVYDFGFHNHVAYIIFKFIDGLTLHEHVRRCHPLAQAEILAIASDLAEILGYMHQHGVIHRDVKPDNVMIQSSDRKVILTDFGLAKKMDTTTVTSDGKVMGSPHYFSPEQAKGEPVDSRSDIYSLGITIFETATGIVPFKGDTPYEVILKHIREPLPDLARLRPDLHPDLPKLVRKCTEKEPRRRFQEAAQLLAALRRVPAPQPEMKTEVVLPRGVPGREEWRRRLRLAAFGAAAVAFVLAGSFWARNAGIRFTAQAKNHVAAGIDAAGKKREPSLGQESGKLGMKGSHEDAGRNIRMQVIPGNEPAVKSSTLPSGTSMERRANEHLAAKAAVDRRAGQAPVAVGEEASAREAAISVGRKVELTEKPPDQGTGSELKDGAGRNDALLPIQPTIPEKPVTVRTASIMDLPAAQVQEYIKVLALITAGPLAGEFKASGAVVLVLRIDEAGHVGLEAMNDADVRVEPDARRQEILSLIRDRIVSIRVQPPVSKAGNEVRVENWRVSLRVGRDRQMLILWRSS